MLGEEPLIGVSPDDCISEILEIGSSSSLLLKLSKLHGFSNTSVSFSAIVSSLIPSASTCLEMDSIRAKIALDGTESHKSTKLCISLKMLCACVTTFPLEYSIAYS